MARKPNGDKAMTSAERQRLYRERHKQVTTAKTTVTMLSKMMNISRTKAWRARFINRFASDETRQKMASNTLSIHAAFLVTQAEREQFLMEYLRQEMALEE